MSESESELESDSEEIYLDDQLATIKNLGIEIIRFSDIFQDQIIDINNETGQTIFLFGSSKSGKTELLKKLAYVFSFSDPEYATIFYTPNAHAKTYNELQDYKKHMAIASHWIPELVLQQYKINRETKNRYKFLNILDDCVDNKNDEVLKEMILTLRNSDISTILSIQDPVLVERMGRSSINYVFLMKFNNDEAIEKIIEKFLSSYFAPMGSMDKKVAFYRDVTRIEQDGSRKYFFVDFLSDKLYYVISD